MGQSIYSVKQVNTYIKNMFTQDFLLPKIYIKGEVSNCKYHTSGHIYFSLKDESGAIACVMFASQRKGLAFSMKNGDQVVAGGSVSVYERDGRYQLYAREITLAGAGILYERFQALKRMLEEMGMFAPEYKQPIPSGIRVLGVVTAPTGAAIRDICNVARRRNPGIQIILYPAQVQGEGAADSIVKGIEMLDRYGVDTLIVGRGGGSIEDLWAFNEEKVARAIFECSVPVISAVGHETDVTIADFVADLRAPTPSAAAELAVDDVKGLVQRMADCRRRMHSLMQGRLALTRQRLSGYQVRFGYLSPQQQIREKRQYLADLQDRLRESMNREIQNRRHRLMLYVERMKGLSPLDKLNQGYSYMETEDGKAVTKIGQVREQDLVRIHVSDGSILAEVKEKENRYEQAGRETGRETGSKPGRSF
ncbi:MAG: exodeoxyribonuclease VII large subunit [Ruminococcus sp.]|jgi:exodeoxyribonuclease VII large subunit